MKNLFARMLVLIKEKSLSSGFSIGVSLLLAIAVMAGAEALLRFRQHEALSERNVNMLALASELRSRVDRELNSVLYLGGGIVGYLEVRHDRVDPAEVRQLLAKVYRYGRHVRNLGVAVGYRLSYVYPLAGNQAAIGHDYRTVPEQWPSVAQAIETRKLVVTGPVPLLQGGEGLIVRYPVFADGDFWGLLSIVVDLSSFRTAVFSGQHDERFEFAVRTEDTAGAGQRVLWGKPELFADPDAIFLEAEMPNGKWVYGVRSVGADASVPAAWMRAVGLLLAALYGAGVYLVLRQRQALSRLAGFDSLTELPNRRLFDDRLEQAVRRLERRESDACVTLVFIDLDGFKPINDVHGHKAGDAVLRCVAQRLRDAVRPGDTVSRWAGDEFVVLLEEAITVMTEELVERLRRTIEQPIAVDGVSLSVTASIGAASYPGEARSPGELLELVDRRMYEDKKRRKPS